MRSEGMRRMEKKKKVLAFGEIMLRLKTPEHLRIVQADEFEAS